MASALESPNRAGHGLRWTALPVFFLLACWAGWWIPLNNDVSWQYWIARQMRGGTMLYRDIIEVNPPLWFWEAIPISALGDRLHVDAGHLAIVSIMLRVTIALALTARLIAPLPTRRAVALLGGLALLLCLLPIHDFGEREHLMLIGAVPYGALLARRRDAARLVSPALAALVGLFAAYGFAMKPHFALVPLALELWLATGLRRRWRPLRSETVALVLVAALYAMAIMLFAPDYARVIVPLARSAYGAFSPPFAWLLVKQLWMPAWLLAAVALATARRHLPTDAQASIVAAAALAIVYLVQGKGFPYHALPVAALLGCALWWLLLADAHVARTMLRRPLTVLALLVLVATGALLGPFTPSRAGQATAALERLPAGSTVAIVSAHSWLAFPLIEAKRFVWPMRTMALWTTPKIAHEGETPDGQRVRRLTLDMIASDLWCHPPDAILFDDPAQSPALLGTRFNYEVFVRADPRVRELLASYRRAESDGATTLYMKSALITPRGNSCHAIRVRSNFG